MGDRATMEGEFDAVENSIRWEPLEVYENFDFSMDRNKYPPPFASEEEAWGFLSGDEGEVLCSQNEPLFSHDFVQCIGALVRNKRTGLVSVIHQSEWSGAASIILCAQRPDDLDVIKIDGPKGRLMEFITIKNKHGSDPGEFHRAFAAIDRDDRRVYSRTDKMKNVRHVFMDRSQIKGVTIEEMEEMFKIAETNDTIGKTTLVGEIEIPLTREESDRWSLLYRPTENIIWIYDSLAHKLFKYPGFEV